MFSTAFIRCKNSPKQAVPRLAVFWYVIVEPNHQQLASVENLAIQTMRSP